MASEAKRDAAPTLPLEDLWQHEEKVQDFGIDVPEWIHEPVYVNDIAAIVQGGCASGAYMPAVTYHEAVGTMSRHGDDVLDFIQNELGELPKPSDAESWSGMAVFYLSMAVELWVSNVEAELTQGG